MGAPAYIQPVGDAWRLYVRLQPNAAAVRILGTWTDGTGQEYLKVAVTTVPEKGKANEALLKFLAKHFRVPRTTLTLIRGETDRSKVIACTQDLGI